MKLQVVGGSNQQVGGFLNELFCFDCIYSYILISWSLCVCVFVTRAREARPLTWANGWHASLIDDLLQVFGARISHSFCNRGSIYIGHFSRRYKAKGWNPYLSSKAAIHIQLKSPRRKHSHFCVLLVWPWTINFWSTLLSAVGDPLSTCGYVIHSPYFDRCDDNPILEPIVIILISDLLHGAPYV